MGSLELSGRTVAPAKGQVREAVDEEGRPDGLGAGRGVGEEVVVGFVVRRSRDGVGAVLHAGVGGGDLVDVGAGHDVVY